MEITAKKAFTLLLMVSLMVSLFPSPGTTSVYAAFPEPAPIPVEAAQGSGVDQDDASITVSGDVYGGGEPVDLHSFISSLGGKSYLPVLSTDGMSIDGDLGDWSEIPAISLPGDSASQVRLPDWNGENDLSGQAKFAYDQEHFYLNFVVKDQIHRGIAGESMWNGDSVQIGFSSNGSSYETEYGFSLANGVPDIWRWLSGSAELPKDTAELAAHRDHASGSTVYEAKIPWKAIFKEKPAQDFRFTFLLNDNDNGTRRGWIQWTDGIGMGKDATKLASVYLVSEMDWLSWLDSIPELRVGERFSTSLDLLNLSDAEITLNAHSQALEIDRDFQIPAGQASRVVMEKTFEEPGEYPIELTVKEVISGKTMRHQYIVHVLETDQQLISRFDELSSKLQDLDQKLKDAEARKIPVDYERVNATVIRNFIQYGKDDVEHGLANRATYVAEELDKLYTEAVSNLSGYLDGSLTARSVPRYVTGSSRIGIKDYSFFADTYDQATGATKRKPVIFLGYGHFDQVRKDISKFKDYGTNIIQVETGPNRVIVPSEAWTVWSSSKTGGVQADITIDRETFYSGKSSLLIDNKTPMTRNVYATVSQRVAVTPNTTYRISAWVKGEGAKNVWFPGGLNWNKRVQVPAGTYDWTKVTLEYTTAPGETVMPFIILSENAGKVWFDELSMTEVGSDQNLLKFPGFDDDAPDSDKGYVMSKTKIQDDIVKVLEHASESDVAVNLLLSPHYFPSWAKEIWPELKSSATEFIQFNFDSPKARQIMRDYLLTVIPMVKDYPSLHSITLTNEPVYASNKDAAYHLPKFQLYLKDVYKGGIRELNDVYGTNYGSFEDVRMPIEYSATPAYYDWYKFNNQLFTGWHQWMADIIHEIAPDLPVKAKVMNGILGGDTWGIDFEMMSDLSQINGNDASNYLSNGKRGHLRENMFYDFQSSLKRAPIFNSEHHIIPDGDHHYIPEQEEHVKTLLWQGAIHGRSASTLWVWDRTYDNSSVTAGSIMHRPDVAATVGETTLDLNRLVDEVSAFQADKPRVAILYSMPAVLYEVRNDYPDSIRSLYEGLSLSGVKVGFITEKQLKEGKTDPFKMILVPKQRYLEDGTLESLNDYAKAGGKLAVIGDDSLQLNERSQPLNPSLRSSVLDKAAVLDTTWGAGQLKEWFINEPVYQQINSVVLIDEATKKSVSDIEWRSVQHNGKWLVNMANYGESAQTVSVYVNGRKVEQAVNLLDGIPVEDTIHLLPRTMKLLKLDIDTTHSERRTYGVGK